MKEEEFREANAELIAPLLVDIDPCANAVPPTPGRKLLLLRDMSEIQSFLPTSCLLRSFLVGT